MVKLYYTGLPSTPVLVARTTVTPWQVSVGPGAYPDVKELRTVGNHALGDIWEDNLALKLHALLASMKVQWTSTDVVRIGNAGELSAPVILWIGVMPASLSSDDGAIVASKCKALLIESNIIDVDVEIRESVVTRSVGTQPLLPSTYSSDFTVDVREPLTTTLGLPICAQPTPLAEGTGSFFISESGNPKRLLLVTARHVVFPPNARDNKHYKYENDSQPRVKVRLFGDTAFSKYLASITAEIVDKKIIAEHHEARIRAAEGEDDPAANKEHRKAAAKLDEAKEAIKQLECFYQDVSTRWAIPGSRILGHVILSPPIGVGGGDKSYTEDWAVIEIDASKVNASNFNGNAIDLGTRIPVGKFTRMMYLNAQSTSSFKYPRDRLLKLTGTISDDEMRRLPALDQDSEPCLMVIKHGNATSLTIGRANNICSFTRTSYYGKGQIISKEWPILPFDSKSGPFSDKGDSGSVIVDGRGRIGGLLTGGTAQLATLPSDITYATPISFLLERMQDHGLHNVNVNPILAT